MKLTFETPNGELKYSTRWIPTSDGGLIFEDERIEVVGHDTSHARIVNLGSGHSETKLIEYPNSNDPAAKHCLTLLRGCKLFHFHDRPPVIGIKSPANVEVNHVLAPDASNLAHVLYSIQRNDPVAYRRITTLTQRAMPGFERFIVMPNKPSETEIILKWKHKDRDHEFGSHQFPSGGFRFLALSTLLLQHAENLPSLISLDEPELGLHPRTLELFSDMAIAASVDSQVILATQSSILVDYFEPRNILVTDQVDGATEFKSLDSRKLSVWLEKYSLGELWERNYLGGGIDS